MVIILLGFAHLVVSVYEVGKEEVKLPDGHVDVVGVDAKGRVETVWRLLQPLSIC